MESRIPIEPTGRLVATSTDGSQISESGSNDLTAYDLEDIESGKQRHEFLASVSVKYWTEAL